MCTLTLRYSFFHYSQNQIILPNLLFPKSKLIAAFFKIKNIFLLLKNTRIMADGFFKKTGKFLQQGAQYLSDKMNLEIHDLINAVNKNEEEMVERCMAVGLSIITIQIL